MSSKLLCQSLPSFSLANKSRTSDESVISLKDSNGKGKLIKKLEKEKYACSEMKICTIDYDKNISLTKQNDSAVYLVVKFNF